MNLDELYTAVTEAIRELEEAERKVSRIEEEIANQTTPASVEGHIARRNAVRAAVAGRDEDRARSLVASFVAENGVEATFVDELRAILS